MREHISPVQLVMTRVPKDVLEAQYKIILPEMDSHHYTTATFLKVLASKKGWYTGSGNPAEMRAAKLVMKDYTTGRLLHCQLRPDFDPAVHKACRQNGFNLKMDGLDVIQEDEEVKAAMTAALSDEDDATGTATSMVNTTITT